MVLTRIGNVLGLCRWPSCKQLLIGKSASARGFGKELKRRTQTGHCSRGSPGSRSLCSKSQPGNSESNREDALNEEDDDDWSNMDTSLKSSADSQNINEESDQGFHHANDSDEDYMKPQPRKERIRKCLAKLKKGPDGRFINVLEVTSDINMLIAAYQSLKAESRPTYLIEDSDDEDSMEGIDIQRFRKLQKRLRSGTYRFGTAKEPKKK